MKLLVEFALLAYVFCKPTDLDCTLQGFYTHQATDCANVFSDSSCSTVYPFSTVTAGEQDERPENCFGISVTLFVLLFTSFSMAGNECFDGEEYIVKSSADFSNVKIVNDVDSSTLQRKPVDDKLCGFSMKPSDSTCDTEVNVKFTAVSVSERNGSRCSVYFDQIICVCDYFACNSVKGVFYETMVSTLGTQKTTFIQHPRNENPYELGMRDSSLIICAMKIVENAYGESVRDPISPPYDVAGYKAKYPNLFPKPAEVKAKQQLGYVKFPASTTTLLPSTSTSTSNSTPPSNTPTSNGSIATPAPETSYDTLIWGLIVGCIVLVLIVGAVLGFVGYQLLHI